MEIKLIVFLPLLAALIAGLGQRYIGAKAAKIVTTGALFASCALSWPLFVYALNFSPKTQPKRLWLQKELRELLR